MYGRGRLGHDIFLGEVAISLREMDEVASDQAPDMRNYILGRRTTREKVNISSYLCILLCNWSAIAHAHAIKHDVRPSSV